MIAAADSDPDSAADSAAPAVARAGAGDAAGTRDVATAAPTADLLTADQADRLAVVMQALASPVRLRILSALNQHPCTVTELGARLSLGQTTLSNHLRLLRNLDLVSGHRTGRHVRYTLFDRHVTELLTTAVGHLDHTR